MIGKFEEEDDCNYHWNKPRLKKWSNHPEHLDYSGYTVKSCRNIRLATNEEIERHRDEKELIRQFLFEFDEGEQLGNNPDADVCKCGKKVDATYHYHPKEDTISDFMYCENCNESWGSGSDNAFHHLYLYFVEDKELYCIKRENMFIESSTFVKWKEERL